MRKGEASQKTPPPVLRRTSPVKLKFGMHILEVLPQLSTRITRPRTSPGPELLAPEVTQVDPKNSSGKHGSHIAVGIDSP